MLFSRYLSSFFLNATETPEIYTLSLHDALPIWIRGRSDRSGNGQRRRAKEKFVHAVLRAVKRKVFDIKNFSHADADQDRKSTRLNSSHRCISYAVFCLKKKKQKNDKQ